MYVSRVAGESNQSRNRHQIEAIGDPSPAVVVASRQPQTVRVILPQLAVTDSH